MTVKEMASLGGKARAKKLTPERRKEIARLAGKGNKKFSTVKNLLAS